MLICQKKKKNKNIILKKNIKYVTPQVRRDIHRRAGKRVRHYTAVSAS